MIAGYATVHYQSSINGKKCTDEYLSVQAMKDVESAGIFAIMEQFGEMGMEMPQMQEMPQDFDPAEFERKMQEMMQQMRRE